jgi:hypothetical protein
MLEDGHWVIFVFKEQVFVPTMARTKAGFYMGIEPVEVVDARDHAAVEQALMRAISRGNPSIPTPVRATFPKNPLLKYAKLKSDSSFDKQTKSWQLSKTRWCLFHRSLSAQKGSRQRRRHRTRRSYARRSTLRNCSAQPRWSSPWIPIEQET